MYQLPHTSVVVVLPPSSTGCAISVEVSRTQQIFMNQLQFWATSFMNVAPCTYGCDIYVERIAQCIACTYKISVYNRSGYIFSLLS